MKPRSYLIFVGSELLKGKLNSYPPAFAGKMRSLGVEIIGETTVIDDEREISSAISAACAKADIIIAVGGLGPTFDDLTREGTARALGRKLVFRAELLKQIENRFRKLGREMSETNKTQAYIVDGAIPVKNDNGTAPGQYIIDGKKFIVLLPGPKREWEPMFDKVILTQIKTRFGLKSGGKEIIIKTASLGESVVAEMLSPVMKKYAKAEYSILASPGDVRFCIFSAVGGKYADKIKRECVKILAGAVYGFGNETLYSAVYELLKKKGLSLAVAESCTGGLISNLITETAGVSDVYKGAIIAYSNGVKTKQLGVKAGTIEKFGAVSEQCALEMAKGAIRALSADCAIAVTGIAGPGGGTKTKPVGTVCIAVAVKDRPAAAKTFRILGDRNAIKLRSAMAGLNLLRETLLSV